MPRLVPLLRYLNCSLMGRDVFVKRDLHRGEGVNSVCQAIEVVDQHPDSVRDGPCPTGWLWGHRFSTRLDGAAAQFGQLVTCFVF